MGPHAALEVQSSIEHQPAAEVERDHAWHDICDVTSSAKRSSH